MSNDMFEGVELQSPSNTDVSVEDVVDDGRPSVTDPEWNDWLLEQFTDKEKFDGRPTCAGLRRVAELILGRIVCSRPTQVFPPSNAGDEVGRATVIWEVTFSDGSMFSDVADSWIGNTDNAFCPFNTATAATRAEGRALRKALRLKTVAAEEMTKKDTASVVREFSKTAEIRGGTEGEYNSEGTMTDPQAKLIDVKASQLGINVTALFKEVFDVNVKRKVSKADASDANKKLQVYQKSKGSIPDSVHTGYESNWRD